MISSVVLSSSYWIRLCQYAKWFGAKQDLGILDTAADLILFILSQCATGFPDAPLSSTIQRETGLTPYSEAAKALRYLLCHNANHFLSNPAIAALGGTSSEKEKKKTQDAGQHMRSFRPALLFVFF